MSAPLLTTPMTELEAVNMMLQAIGEAPVNSLDNAFVDATQALTRLRNTSRQIQENGWWFNLERDYPLALAGDNTIPVPTGALSIRLEQPGGFYGASAGKNPSGLQAVQRGAQLYNPKDHTFTFTAGVVVRIVFLVDFEALPGVVRTYIAYTAIAEFMALSPITSADSEKLKLAQGNASRASVAFKREARMQQPSRANLLSHSVVNGILWRPGQYNRVW